MSIGVVLLVVAQCGASDVVAKVGAESICMDEAVAVCGTALAPATWLSEAAVIRHLAIKRLVSRGETRTSLVDLPLSGLLKKLHRLTESTESQLRELYENVLVPYYRRQMADGRGRIPEFESVRSELRALDVRQRSYSEDVSIVEELIGGRRIEYFAAIRCGGVR